MAGLFRLEDISERYRNLRAGLATTHDQQVPTLCAQPPYPVGDDLRVGLDRSVFVCLDQLARNAHAPELCELTLEVGSRFGAIGLVKPTWREQYGEA